MANDKIKYAVVLLIILCLSMNAFSATNFTDDSSDVALQSSDSVDEVSGDAQVDDNQADDTQADDSQNKEETSSSSDNSSTGTGTGTSSGNGSTKPTFNFNGTGTGMNFSGMNFTGMNRTGTNYSNMSLDDILDIFKKLMGGDNATNETNDTVNPEVNDVPEVVTSESYQSVSQPADVQLAQHVVKRVRDNKVVSEGDTLKLEGINKLFDSDFTNGHLLVYVDGKLVFNEITTGDLSTPIFGVADFIGQHQISVEFTSNDDPNGNTNKYTENVIIE
ncbi:hypothetical protein TL18_02230 [Methanobrevibacter sp. YE315]|uniref:hypothetical protein n=1 Tax=Methanobrevibacter sp. YE315 TaxID=1609968 RepID=UPI000764F27E|nr:hypothetical protein [Methanobrevibacter sp. YE315]AMD16942.1 hypothetical protein TL18_02230 [Methanobrevibacter sp. YE315]